MNHLRELLETPSRDRLVPDELSAPAAYKLAGYFHTAAPSAMCFWMGDVLDSDGLKAVEELSHLPFKHCWFEMLCEVDGSSMIIGCLAAKDPAGVQLIGFIRTDGAWSMQWSARADEFNSPTLRVLPADSLAAARAIAMRGKVAVFLTAMNCKNVRRTRVEPDTKLQKARAKRGRQPLFSYWTLELSGRRERGDDKGGTHAGPRLHLRRGHPREYQPGKFTWVTESVVGNKAAGMVHKDYSADPALTAAMRKTD